MKPYVAVSFLTFVLLLLIGCTSTELKVSNQLVSFTPVDWESELTISNVTKPRFAGPLVLPVAAVTYQPTTAPADCESSEAIEVKLVPQELIAKYHLHPNHYGGEVVSESEGFLLTVSSACNSTQLEWVSSALRGLNTTLR